MDFIPSTDRLFKVRDHGSKKKLLDKHEVLFHIIICVHTTKQVSENIGAIPHYQGQVNVLR